LLIAFAKQAAYDNCYPYSSKKGDPVMKTKLRTHLRTVFLFVKNNPHVWLALWVPLYLVMFFAAEAIVSPDAPYYVSYLPIDDKIPFIEYFAIPYVMWFPFLVLPGLYFMIFDGQYFKRYMCFLIIGFTGSIIFCVLFPNGQNLRPEVFPRDNFCSRLVSALYAADTNTNVLPSMHVIGCAAVCSAVLRCPSIRQKWVKAVCVALAVLICSATVFIKQHSFLDIYTALIVCIPIFLLVYGRDMLKTAQKRKARKPQKIFDKRQVL